ncbi:hypothetical protein HPP92_002943 [Vanilla planifolia]|uniref:Uncharacterized protein n=1 Tax=Vanilla planifolia TaxID=51239 RepID=A0A835VN72_VANPL|nr:hypothetical protein HPP92_002943 [Vanilla planifolia]
MENVKCCRLPAVAVAVAVAVVEETSPPIPYSPRRPEAPTLAASLVSSAASCLSLPHLPSSRNGHRLNVAVAPAQDWGDNMILRADNENLKNEIYRLACPNYGGPAMLGRSRSACTISTSMTPALRKRFVCLETNRQTNS